MRSLRSARCFTDAVLSGIVETVCVIVSSSALGRWIDGAPTRLRPLLFTILANRTTLVASCILWLALFSTSYESLRKALFAAILVLGMVEKASRMANILSMERDWVPTIANADGEGSSLTHLNTVMRRIDIVCKFLAPLAISGVVALLKSAPAAITIAIMSSASLVLEVWAVLRVWKTNSRLRASKGEAHHFSGDVELEARYQLHSEILKHDVHFLRRLLARSPEAVAFARSIIGDHIEGLNYYFSTTVWLPSVCVAVLHASVLAWSGTLITWLLNANFSLGEVTVAKGIGSFFEIGSTVVFPWAVSVFSETRSDNHATTSYQMVERRGLDDEDEADDYQAQKSPDKVDPNLAEDSGLIGSRSLHVGVVRAALWAISSLLFLLIPTTIVLFYLNSHLTDNHSESGDTVTSPLAAHTLLAVGFFTFLSLSFLGRWTYDLAVTQLSQMLIPATHRSSFGGMEQAIISCVSLVIGLQRQSGTSKETSCGWLWGACAQLLLRPGPFPGGLGGG